MSQTGKLLDRLRYEMYAVSDKAGSAFVKEHGRIEHSDDPTSEYAMLVRNIELVFEHNKALLIRQITEDQR